MTAGHVRSPRAYGFDHLLGQDAGEAPEPHALQGTDWAASLLSYRYPLCSLAEWRGMRGPSSFHLGVLRFVCFGGNYLVGAREHTRRV
jgi:hypothetical protein